MAAITTRVTSGNSATVKNAPLSNSEIDQNFININNAVMLAQSLGKDLTGFVNTTTSTLAFNETTRTLTLTPVGTLNVYVNGIEYPITAAKTIQIADTSGGHFIIYDHVSGTLLDVGASINTYIQTNIIVAYVYWQSVGAKAIIFADERHNTSRDTLWHYSQHLDVGAIWRSGGNISYTASNANLVNIGLSTPIQIADEDLEMSIVHAASPVNNYEQVLNGTAYIPTLYLSGTTYRQTTPTNLPWYAGTNRAAYNLITAGSGSMVDVPTDNYYLNYWIVATNDVKYPIKAIVGRNYYATLTDAEAELLLDYGLPMPEIAPLYKVTLQTSSTYTQNTPKVVISAVKEIYGRQNRRNTQFDGLPHNVLTNRYDPNQHNIASITGLQTALDLKANTADVGGLITASDILTKIKTVDGTGSGLDADLLDGYDSSVMFISNGSWYGTNMPGTVIKSIDDGSSGNFSIGKNNPSAGRLSVLIDGYFYAAEQGGFFAMSGQDYTARKGWYTDGTNSLWNSHVVPTANNTYNLGSSTAGWANVYTNDLHLSNMNKPEGNDIDGTNGNWTIQEGQTNLYIINNRNGKKYKFNLEEV